MIPDSDGLHAIANSTDADRTADIVFLHGLGGLSHRTWRHGKQGQPGHFFWPEELGKDLPNCGIWTVGYPAGLTALGKPGMIIEKRAGNLSQKLANAGLGERPLFFIVHSMAGLIVKSLIVGSQTLADADRKRLVSMIRGIVFCATPHSGSAFADAAGILGEFFGGSQDHVDEMRTNAEPLDILHDQFVEWHRINQIPVESYAENIGLKRKNWLGRLLPLDLVVPRASANPHIAGHTVRDVDDDHLSLVKPPNRQHDVYAGVLRFIRDALATDASAHANVTPAERPHLLPNKAPAVHPTEAEEESLGGEKSETSLERRPRIESNPGSQIVSGIIVFISYSHDSAAHREKVLALSERLRRDGIETRLDQYVNGSPEQGWPRWMLDQLDAADSVLVVCTETYYRRFRGHEAPGKGKGVDWEGALITQELYDTRRRLKFVPVFLSVAVDDWIPEPLRSATHFALTSEEAYGNLYDFLLEQAGVEPHPIGTLKPKARRKGSALTFEETPVAAVDRQVPLVPSSSSPSSPALSIWQKKLAFLEAEEAKAADAEQKFSIQQRIDEARAKIQEFGGLSP